MRIKKADSQRLENPFSNKIIAQCSVSKTKEGKLRAIKWPMNPSRVARLRRANNSGVAERKKKKQRAPV